MIQSTDQRVNDPSAPFVSVIIPVFNDTDRLRICLEALEHQTYPKDLYEIIVVDNGSEDNVEKLVAQFDQTSFAQETQPGSYAARNKGISVAKGSVIAFTDSDCIPASDWIEKGASNILKVPNCGLIAGKINLFFKNPDKPTAVEVYEKGKAFDQKKNIEQLTFAVTANLFTLRSVIAAVGPFNQVLKSRGDIEWGNRVFSAGYKQVYADDTCVAHPARYSLGQLYQKSLRVEGGNYTWKRRNTYSVIHVAEDFIKLIKSILGLLYRFIVGMSPSERLDGTKQKIQYILIFVFVRFVYISERLRLRLGGIPKR